MKSYLKEIDDFKDKNGNVSPGLIISAVDTNLPDLERTFDLPLGTLTAADSTYSNSVQVKLENMLLVIFSAISHEFFETLPQSYQWYATEKIPSFGDRTAADLVNKGLTNAILNYIERTAVGGYA